MEEVIKHNLLSITEHKTYMTPKASQFGLEITSDLMAIKNNPKY